MLTDDLQAIESKMADALKQIVTLTHQNAQLQKLHDDEMDAVFVEFVKVIDAFDSAEKAVRDKGYDLDSPAALAIQRFLNVKSKAMQLLEKFDVRKITFPSGMADDSLCVTVDTEPDPDRTSGQIISIERDGYTRAGRLLRRADVISVKN